MMQYTQKKSGVLENFRGRKLSRTGGNTYWLRKLGSRACAAKGCHTLKELKNLKICENFLKDLLQLCPSTALNTTPTIHMQTQSFNT